MNNEYEEALKGLVKVGGKLYEEKRWLIANYEGEDGELISIDEPDMKHELVILQTNNIDAQVKKKIKFVKLHECKNIDITIVGVLCNIELYKCQNIKLRILTKRTTSSFSVLRLENCCNVDVFIDHLFLIKDEVRSYPVYMDGIMDCFIHGKDLETGKWMTKYRMTGSLYNDQHNSNMMIFNKITRQWKHYTRRLSDSNMSVFYNLEPDAEEKYIMRLFTVLLILWIMRNSRMM